MGLREQDLYLLIKKYSLEKEIWGGSQERNRRAGTENVHGILGLGVALEEFYENLEENVGKRR